MNRRSSTMVALFAGAVLAASLASTSASASGSTDAACQVTAHVTISPGLSLVPSSGVFGTYSVTDGQTTQTPGTADCTGTVDGAQVTGPGVVTIDGTYGTGALKDIQGGDTCAEGSGSGAVALSVPTTDGTRSVTGEIDIITAGSTGEATGTLGDAQAVAAFNFTADAGEDCASTPVTGVSVQSATLNISDSASAAAGFNGSCSVQGDVTFSPPLTNSQQTLDVTYDANGSCTGSVNGRQVTNAPVSLKHRARQVDGSCLHAQTTVPGHGRVRFMDGSTVPYDLDFVSITTEVAFTLRPARSSPAHGHGTFLTQRTSPDSALLCAGAGVSHSPMDMTFRTDAATAG